MKKLLSILLAATIIIFAVCLLPCRAPAQAAETVPADTVVTLTVPQIRITTAEGNGTSLQKEDGYVSASVTITDTDCSVLRDSVLFKVRGNSTALSFVAKKSFTFKFDKKTNVLGMGKGKKWALLANTFDPTLMRNYLAFELARTMGLPYTSEQKYVELWVDDSYRGCYTLMEPVQEGKDRVDIDIKGNDGMKDFMIEREATRVESDVTYFTADGVRFAVSEPEEPSDEQLAYIKRTVEDIFTVVKSGSPEEIEKVIDVPSFVRFYLLNELYKTVDFDYSSVFFFYKDGVLYAGPAWDYDLAAGNVNPDYTANAKASSEPEGLFAANRHFYKYLCSYRWFNERIRTVFQKYYGDITALYARGGQINRLLNTYGGIFDRNYSVAGWSASKWQLNVQKRPLATFDANVDYLRDWLKQRCEWLAAYYEVEPQEEGQYLIGDADGDSEITVLDATTIQRVLAEIITDEDGGVALRGDSNGDGLDITDATAIQRYLADYPVSVPIGEYGG